MANETIFRRHPGNPIITAKAVPGANSIFNSAVLRYKDGYAGVFRVDMQDIGSTLHSGFSRDGLNWDIEERLIDISGKVPAHMRPGMGYDPRVTELEGGYYVTWCYYPGGPGPCIGLARTKDFRKYTQLAEVMFPYNRNALLFPRKIRGKYAALHRPSDQGHTPFGVIYYATSTDLINWGEHKFMMGPASWWEGTKIGAGPVPIETKEGWLLIYHGVRTTCSGFVYCAGGAILDLHEPWKVRYRSRKYLLAPTEPYEMVGDVPNVLFPNSAIVDWKTRQVALYYGGADTVVGLAHADIDELMKFIKKNSR